jgi:hypothetical protein
VTDDDFDSDVTPEEAASTLGASLKSCHAVIKNYRAMLLDQTSGGRDDGGADVPDQPIPEEPHS